MPQSSCVREAVRESGIVSGYLQEDAARPTFCLPLAFLFSYW